MNRLYSVDNDIKWLFKAIHPRLHGVWCCLEVQPKLLDPQRPGMYQKIVDVY